LKNRPYLAGRTALALAAIAALGAAPIDAQALGLGRLNVQSALGEGMRAEIDITSLSPEEAATLQVRLASPEAYRAAGVDYNAVLAGAQATLARRADGRAYLRVTSDRAVQEPFIEVIVELNSASGRLVREFTLLFDPPGSRAAPPVQAAAPVAPVMSAAPTSQPASASALPSATPLPLSLIHI
jgi:pilus assembly protein FimV